MADTDLSTEDGFASQRVLILGSDEPRPGITVHPWHERPPSLNITDYDIVVFDFTDLGEESYSARCAGFSEADKQQICRFLFAKDTLAIAIGDPVLRFGGDARGSVDAWLPIKLGVVREAGIAVTNVDPELAEYFDHVLEWRSIFDGQYETRPGIASVYLRHVDPGFVSLSARLVPLATTRDGKPLGLEMTLTGWASSGGSPSWRADNIMWLPSPTDIGSDEAVDILLRKLGWEGASTAAPLWSEAYELPTEKPLLTDLTELDSSIADLRGRRDELSRDLEGIRRYRRLLYDTGSGLETIVEEALAELGATSLELTSSDGAKREDMRLRIPEIGEAIVEVKSRLRSGLKLEDVRQLGEWTDDARDVEDWDGKAILVINAFAELPPGERKETFADRPSKAARRRGQALLTGIDVFDAIVAHQQGDLELGDFWRAVAATEGPFGGISALLKSNVR